MIPQQIVNEEKVLKYAFHTRSQVNLNMKSSYHY
jgi:hypothetical protein